VLNALKYRRFAIDIDKSSNRLEDLDHQRDPVFVRDTVFLKLIIQGKASLYEYEVENLKRYFIETDDSGIRQLIYKRYLNSSNKIMENLRYRQQLWSELGCENITLKTLNKVKYAADDLSEYVVNYNQCSNSAYIKYGVDKQREHFNLFVRPGLVFSSLSINNSTGISRDIDFGSKLNIRFGLEAEFVLPFNKNKWALFAEPNFQYYQAENIVISQLIVRDTQAVSVNYRYIELPIGARHYFYLNNDSKLFLNTAFVLDFDFNSEIEFERSQDLEILGIGNLALGIGYNYGDKFNCELRYGLNRDVLVDYKIWKGNFKSISFMIGYNLF